MTLTNRTPRVTGGSQLRSTTRVEVTVVERAQESQRLVVHVLEVADQCGRIGRHRLHEVRVVAVAGVCDVDRQPEPVGPSLGRPDLFLAVEPGDVIVLDAGQVPDEPGDGVGLAVRPEGQLLGREPVDRGVHGVTNPLEGVLQHISTRHSMTSLTSACRRRPARVGVRLSVDGLGR